MMKIRVGDDVSISTDSCFLSEALVVMNNSSCDMARSKKFNSLPARFIEYMFLTIGNAS
jgi:hypothetical protein